MDNTKDVVDVEFETVTAECSSRVAQSNPATVMPGAKQANGEEQLSVFGKTSNTGKRKTMSLPVFTLVASICAVAAFYMAGGHVLFENQATKLNAQEVVSAPLQFEDISTETIDRDGNRILTIRATIANKDKIAHVLPPVIVHFGDDPATRRMFRINRGETLNPGERLVFTNTVPSGDVLTDEPKLTFSE